MALRALVLFLISLFANSGSASEFSANSLALFVTVENGVPHKVTKELFDTVVGAVLARDRFQIVPFDEIIKIVGNSSQNVPVVERRELLDSLANKGSKLLPTIQGPLETLAVNNAWIVDCAPQNDSSVKSCGLYVYNRDKAKLTASVEKRYVVPLADASRWAKPLVDNLISGLRDAEEQKNQALLERVLAGKDDVDDITAIEVRGGVGFTSQRLLSTDSTPSAVLSVLHESKQMRVELGGAYMQSNKRSNGITRSLRGFNLGAGVNLYSPALERLVWELGLTGGYGARNFKEHLSEQKVSMLYISLQPGLGVRITDTLRLTATVPYFFHSVLEKSGQNDLTDAVYDFGIYFMLGYRM